MEKINLLLSVFKSGTVTIFCSVEDIEAIRNEMPSDSLAVGKFEADASSSDSLNDSFSVFKDGVSFCFVPGEAIASFAERLLEIKGN